MNEELKRLIVKEFSASRKESKSAIPLVIPPYGPDEIIEVVDSLLSTNVTMGKKVAEFERLFSGYVGSGNGIMVNSGSSANLIALSVLSNRILGNRISPGDEVITPAVTWSTTVFPIINAGAVPVLADVGDDYLINADSINELITPKTKAIMPVHLLGNPVEMKPVMEIAEDNGLFVIEDCCEAHGAEYHGRKVGSMGHMSAYSFYFSHHITTIEGGMVLTDNGDYADLARMARAHGWVREIRNRTEIEKRHPEIDPRFLFVNMGYNLRPTDLQGGFGIHQMKRLEGFIEARRKNAEYWTKELSRYSDIFVVPEERKDTRHVWFGYALTIREGAGFSRNEITKFLGDKGIETRPVMAGNICQQPAMKLFSHRKGGLKNSDNIMKNSFFFGNHHGVGPEQRKYLVDAMGEFLSAAR